jgi:predicted nucleic acid-binding protein
MGRPALSVHEWAAAYVDIVADRHALGRPISQFDAQIAAIARTAGARVATWRTDDFLNCGVALVDPWAVPVS